MAISFGYVTDRCGAGRPKHSRVIGTTMISPYALLLLLAGLAWQPSHAAPLYKWADRSGRVTYSSLPPPAGIQAETIQVQPLPSAEDVRQAKQREQKAAELASEMEARRRKQEAEEARRRAMQPPPAPVVIEQPVYVPQPIYYPPVRVAPRHHSDKPRHDRPR